ncbi:MAG: T9SS type B sorting domain-containing protein [Paludibacteraceae bacterium]|nr:T9SS type B sorting domain-containing protein [Paludibacteraceae bacterium]
MSKMNHKLLKLLLFAVSVVFGMVAANAQSCSTVFAGTTFQPKSGITDTNYDLDKVKFEDPSSESLSTGTSFVSTSGGMTQGKYTITKKGMEIAASVTGEKGLFFRYSLNDLITTAGKNTYKVEITFEVAACVTCTKECHRGINFKQVWTDNGGTKDQYKEYQKGSHTWSQTFTATTPKASIAFSADHSNHGLKMIIKSIKVTGCVDQKIVSENGNKVCAGEPNVLIAKGLNASTYKWEKSTDAKATWETLPGTESTITVEVNGETYFRVTAGGTTLTTDKITSVVCCSVAGKREAQLTVDFTSSQLNATNHVNFNQLNDSKSQAITATYTYKASGKVDEDQYAIVNQPSSGGYWEESAITDHTHIKQGRAGTNNDGFLLVNCGKAEKEMFQYTITTGNLCQNTIYDFSAYIANIDSNTDPSHEPVNAGFQVYGMPGNKLLVNAETGDLPYTGEWVEKAESFNSGNYKQFKLIIKNNHVQTGSQGAVIGNDIGIDDIEFSTCTPDVKIYTDDKYKSKDTIVCDDGKTVHLKLEAHAVYDLSTFFKTPYYLFQTSTDKTTWKNVKTDAQKETYIEIDVPKDEIYETGLWYRVWVGGDKAAVEQSASSGTPGEGCGKLTAASEPILIQYQCKCSPTAAPTVKDYSECPVTVAPYTKPLKDLITSQYDKLRFYESQEGGTDLGENATFDATVVGTKTYYVTNQKNTDPATHIEYCESPRTPINIEIKDAAVFDVTPTSIEKCFNGETPDSELTFTASKAEYDYTWKSASISATGTSYTLERKASSGTITVVAKDPQGKVCDASKDVTYKISPAPEFTITSPSMVCVSNPEAEITVKFTSGSGHYVLTKNGATLEEGDMSLGQTEVIIKDIVVATSKGKVSYKFSVVNQLGCENSKEFEIAVNDRVEIPLVPTAPVVNNTICLGDKFDINATYTFGAGESLNWYIDGVQVPGESGLTLTEQAPIKDTEYTVDLIGGLCEGSGALSIKVKQTANPDIYTDKDVICVGTTINITDIDAEDAETYIWYSSTEKDVWNVMTGETGKNITDFAPTVTASYKKVSKNGSCEAESNVITVEVHPAIEFTIEPIDKNICKNQEVTLKMSGYPEGAALQWKEKVSGTELSTEATAVVKPSETTVYTATVIKVCEASKELTITVFGDLNPTISPDVAICEGDTTTLTVDGVGITSVQWSPATGLSSTTEKTVTASPAVTTEYTATISNGVCSDEAKVTVSVSSTPHFDKVTEVAGESCATRGVMVEGKGGVPPYSYSTDGVTYSQESTLIGLKSGYTMLYIMDSFTCKSDTTINLAPYAINPDKFFTPNDDGNNDLWQVENLSCYEGYIVEIFDRYGRRLYIYKKGSFSGGSVKDDFPGWDGYYNGHQMPSTDYWYLITVEEIRKQYNGHFTLKR